MEIEEIKNCWKEEERQIAEKMKVNKEASFKKLRTSFERIKIKRFYQVTLMCISTPLIILFVVFPHVKNDGSLLFYLAITFFILPIAVSFIANIYFYTYLLKIDLADSILKTQKEIMRLETFEKKQRNASYMFLPITFLCAFKTFGFTLNKEVTIMIVFFIIITIIGYIVNLKYLLPRDYRKIKSYLDEIDDVEKV